MRDKRVEQLLKKERKRQRSVINLIASENFVSSDVLKALGSEPTNKYAEGYPRKRYYGGNKVIDEIEELAQNRALKLFGLSPKRWRVNVQPLSGSPANLAVYAALVPLGGKIMGMALAHGGHLTHGHSVSFTGKFWKQIPYRVSPKSEQIDYDALKGLAKKEKPAIIIAGFTAYPRRINFRKFREIVDASKSYLLVDMSHFAGLVAGKVYPSPFPYADVVTTTTHKTLRGPRSAMIFSRREFSDRIDRAVFPGLQGGPHMNQIAAVAVALHEAMRPSFHSYAKRIVLNARALADELRRFQWRLVSGGTDSHLVLVDTWMGGRGLSGKEAEKRLERNRIIVNKNTIPFDSRSPADPSGIRLGTAAVTTRGIRQKEMRQIARLITLVLKENRDVRKEAEGLCKKFR